MSNATFRFYARLNSFLPPARRQRSFAVNCTPNATVKHMIEALGAPHTEIEFILVNGKSVGFEYLIQPDDRIAVYPPFYRLKPDDAVPLRASLTAFRFIADAHMGALARLLRLAGFDTLYYPAIHDDEIANYCAHEPYIVLTRDRELLKRSQIIYGCYIRPNKPDLQLREVFERYSLAEHVAPFSRCLVCNGTLHSVDKNIVLDRLPPLVRERHSYFLKCSGCDRVYWEGTHWDNLRAQLNSLLTPTSDN
ncbi:Mut7-C RNAse domain-containing protein [Pseudomonas asuensis]|jgi:uncharacterized protein with PIN domain|uniref:Mut7-C RNAse domain-containing protein n=1 Tax=Pseudomonas asuensis TaxID=1825787 RepID=UPI00166EF4E1|nr:Mut7-C RNAse domain-containing protein [Pseudomonas asuensis]